MTRVAVHKVKRAPSATGSTPSWLAAPQRFGVLQRRSHGQSEPASVPPIVHEVLNSPGQPLDAATRAYMEPRFGHDFSKVRVHADGQAAAAASSINARAFTSNESVVFGAHAFAPQTDVGRRLVAHELTHVVQQRRGMHLKDGIGHVGDAHERQADAVGERVTGGQSALPMFGVQSSDRAERGTIADGQATVQRQAISAQPREIGDEPKENTEESKSWIEIIPDAVAKAPDKKQREVHGKKTAQGGLTKFAGRKFSYAQAGTVTKKGDKVGKVTETHEIATAGELNEGVTQADVDKAVTAIIAERAKILPRYMSPVNKGGSGYRTLPGAEEDQARKAPAPRMGVSSIAALEGQKAAEASQSYTKWLSNASPTRAKNLKGIKDIKDLKDDKDKKKLLIANKISRWEGSTSAINAYDRANITWGWGFAASGKQAQQLTLEVFRLSPKSRDAFFRAGIIVDADNKEYVVVDTEKKWKLHGLDAELYIRANTTLLSLMVNVAQGVLPEKTTPGEGQKGSASGFSSFAELMKNQNWYTTDQSREMPEDKPNEPIKGDPAVEQAVLDANFNTLLANTLKDSDKILADNSWTLDELALAAHAIHMTNAYTWRRWEKFEPHELKDIVQKIYDTTPGSFKEIVVPEEWRKLIDKPKKQTQPKVEKVEKKAKKT